MYMCLFLVCVCMCVWCVYVYNEHGPNLYILVRDVTQSMNFGQFMDCPGRSMDPCLEQAIYGLPAVPSPSLLLNPRIE